MERSADATASVPSRSNQAISLYYWSYFALGMGLMTPFWALLSAVDYFQTVYPERETVRWINCFFYGTAIATIIANSLVPAKDKGHDRVSFGFLLFISMVLFIPLMDLVLVKEKEGTQLTFVLLMFSAAVIGVGNGLIEGCCSAIAIYSALTYSEAYIRGMGSSALLNVALRVITKAAFMQAADGLRTSARVYFVVSGTLCLVCLLAHRCVVVPHSASMETERIDEEQCLLEKNTNEGRTPGSSVERMTESTWIGAASMVKLEALNTFLIQIPTYTVFPGVTSDVKSDTLGDWYGVVLVAVYSIGSSFIRELPSSWTITRLLPVTSIVVARFLLIPLTFFTVQHTYNPFVLSLLILTLGASHGYEMMCMFGMGQQKMQGGVDAFVSGNVYAFAILLGTFIASFGSIGWSMLD